MAGSKKPPPLPPWPNLDRGDQVEAYVQAASPAYRAALAKVPPRPSQSDAKAWREYSKAMMNAVGVRTQEKVRLRLVPHGQREARERTVLTRSDSAVLASRVPSGTVARLDAAAQAAGVSRNQIVNAALSVGLSEVERTDAAKRPAPARAAKPSNPITAPATPAPVDHK